MYFLWKRTEHGTIRVSREGLSDLVRSHLGPSRLYSLAMAATGCAPSDEGLVTVVLASRDPSHEPKIAQRIKALLAPLGMAVSVVWADRGSPGAAWIEMRPLLFTDPWAWMALTSSVALVVLAGWAGFFWTAFWGAAAWFIARGLGALFGGGGRALLRTGRTARG